MTRRGWESLMWTCSRPHRAGVNVDDGTHGPCESGATGSDPMTPLAGRKGVLFLVPALARVDDAARRADGPAAERVHEPDVVQDLRRVRDLRTPGRTAGERLQDESGAVRADGIA